LLFLNPDTAYQSGSLSGALDYMDKTRQTAVMGCRLLNSDGTTQQSFRRFPTTAVILARGLGADRWSRRPGFYEQRMMAGHVLDEPTEVDWVFGAFMLARRAHFGAVGGMDVGYRLYYEDVDLCFRLRQRGFRTVYYPALVFLHHHARTSARRPFGRLWRWHLRSAFRFLTKHGFSVRSPDPDRQG
jgi:GT2 family glycosyltransferase